MFNGVGGKIKDWATVVSWLGIIASVITGVVLLINGYGRWGGGDVQILCGFMIIIFGPLLSWFSGTLLYGFGELIDVTNRNETILRSITEALHKMAGEENAAENPGNGNIEAEDSTAKEQEQMSLEQLDELREKGQISEGDYWKQRVRIYRQE